MVVLSADEADKGSNALVPVARFYPCGADSVEAPTIMLWQTVKHYAVVAPSTPAKLVMCEFSPGTAAEAAVLHEYLLLPSFMAGFEAIQGGWGWCGRTVCVPLCHVRTHLICCAYISVLVAGAAAAGV